MSSERKDLFMHLYGPVHNRFERFCKARVYGEMDHMDLMHETIMVAFQKFKEDTSVDTFPSFLFGIAVRLLANNRRKEQQARKHVESRLLSDTYEDPSIKREDVEELYKALNALPVDQKDAVILFEISGYSIREIAGICNVSENLVKQRLFRGRQKLKEILASQHELINTNSL
jgi:RNA polymerase sigma-70 factor (ECF subfamily)